MANVNESPEEFRRKQFLRLTRSVFDAVVIGGGITGAGVAWQLARWGIKVALVERGDFASGTSSRSSKLIHGGFRYLPQGEVRLVHQVARERTRLAHLMPHLIRPLAMTVPAYRGGPFPLPLLAAGSWIYDRLGPIDRAHRPKRLSPEDVCERAPGISRRDLAGGIAYFEFSGHDARITWSVIRTSQELGAVALNYVRADLAQSRLNPEGLSDIWIQDTLSGERGSVRARVVVNAAGPWADVLDHRARLIRSRGIHLVFSWARFPISYATVLPTLENANLFAVPLGPITYVGTTDQRDEGTFDYPVLPLDDAQYLLDVVNRIFPNLTLTLGDVVAAWSGVRPLIATESPRATDQLSRRDVVLASASLITVLGGKFTGFRATADGVTRAVLRRLGGTGASPLPEYIVDAPDVRSIRALAAKLSDTYQLGQDWSWRLIQRYGTRAQELLASALPDALVPVAEDAPMLAAEVDWAIEHEQVYTLSDLLIRRTGLAWLSGMTPEQLVPVSDRVANRLQERLGWSAEQRANELRTFADSAYISDVTRFRQTS